MTRNQIDPPQTLTLAEVDGIAAPPSPPLPVDPLILKLFDKLPPAGADWPLAKRVQWLNACGAVFRLLYSGDDEQIISIELK